MLACFLALAFLHRLVAYPIISHFWLLAGVDKKKKRPGILLRRKPLVRHGVYVTQRMPAIDQAVPVDPIMPNIRHLPPIPMPASLRALPYSETRQGSGECHVHVVHGIINGCQWRVFPVQRWGIIPPRLTRLDMICALSPDIKTFVLALLMVRGVIVGVS